MNQRVTSNINIENAKIIWRNFRGIEGPFNKAGSRSFCVVIESPDLAEKLRNDGWNVKHRGPQKEGDEPFDYLSVEVRFDNRPPQILLFTENGTKTVIDEENVDMLDYEDIATADLVISPYNWSLQDGRTGVKAYLSKAYITIEENDIHIENAKIIWRNFRGEERPFNKAGCRNFCVVIESPDLAEKLRNDGWNVKHRGPREEGDEPFDYLSVEVRFDNRPPQILLFTENGTTTVLDEDSVDILDYADIAAADLDIAPYNWSWNDGRTGVKAYLHKAYIAIEEDVFASKYQAPANDEVIPF